MGRGFARGAGPAAGRAVGCAAAGRAPGVQRGDTVCSGPVPGVRCCEGCGPLGTTLRGGRGAGCRCETRRRAFCQVRTELCCQCTPNRARRGPQASQGASARLDRANTHTRRVPIKAAHPSPGEWPGDAGAAGGWVGGHGFLRSSLELAPPACGAQRPPRKSWQEKASWQQRPFPWQPLPSPTPTPGRQRRELQLAGVCEGAAGGTALLPDSFFPRRTSWGRARGPWAWPLPQRALGRCLLCPQLHLLAVFPSSEPYF